MSDIKETISSVRDHELSIERLKSQISTLNEELQEELEAMDEFDDVNNLSEQLKIAREKLKIATQSNPRYMNLTEKKAELQETLVGHKHILSEQLVAYFAQTKERQIEMGANGDARAVVLTGKLGKSQKYQTSLLSPIEEFDSAMKETGVQVEISDGSGTVVIGGEGIKKSGK